MDEKVDRCREQLSVAREAGDHTSVDVLLSELADAIDKRYQQTWQLEDVEERILLHRETLRILQCSNVNLDDRGGRDASLNEKIGARTSADLVLIENDPRAQSEPVGAAADSPLPNTDGITHRVQQIRIYLARALEDRYRHIGQADDLEEAINLCRAVLLKSLMPSNTVDAMQELGRALLIRFNLSGDMDSLNEALALHREVLQRLPKDHPNLHMALIDVGMALLRRYEYSNQVDHHLEALGVVRKALDLCPPEHPDRHHCHHHLGSVMFTGYVRSDIMAELEETVTHMRQALLLRSPRHRDRHIALNNFGLALAEFFLRTQDVCHLDESISCHREALQARSGNHPLRPSSLANLGSSLVKRFNIVGHLPDNDEGILLLRQAASVGSTNSYRRCIILTSLANALQNRFLVTGGPSDLAEAIQMRRQVLEFAGTGHPFYSIARHNLANSLCVRFDHYGEPGDLSHAIMLLRSLPDSDEDPFRLSLLAEALKRRYDQQGDIRDLQEAITLREQCLQANHYGDAWVYDGLASLLLARFSVIQDLEDLNRGADLCHEVLEGRPQGHRDRHRVLRTLANVLVVRFQQTSNPDDAKAAMRFLEEARSLLPEGRADHPQILCSIAHLHLLQNSPEFDPAQGVCLLLEVLRDSSRSPKLRLGEAMEVFGAVDAWDTSFNFNGARSQLLEVYEHAVKLLPQVAYVGLVDQARLRVLHKAELLGNLAAAHALLVARPETALELLEAGRAMFWTQYLRLRQSFHMLPDDLAQRLKDVSSQLDAEAISKSSDMNSVAAVLFDDVARRRQLSAEFERIVNQARSLPGLDRFMCHNTFSTLLHAASRGPVIVLLANKDMCHAVVLKTPCHSAQHIRIVGLNARRLAELVETLRVSVHRTRSANGNRGMRKVVGGHKDMSANGILAELWKKVMKPMLEALDLPIAHGSARPRTFICATSAFAHVPLHAAGQFGVADVPKGECVTDYAVPSYIPTLDILLRSRDSFMPIRRESAKVLLAAAPDPDHWRSLPYAALEVETIKQMIPPHAFMTPDGVPPNAISLAHGRRGVTVDNVLRTMTDAPLVHLACHGRQDPHNPLASGFVLADGMLTLARLMTLNLPQAFFAYLSACESAKGDTRQPDQAVHLAAAMLFAGFKSVIGTMWSMSDVDGPVVARRVYAQLFAGDSEFLDPDAIPYALDAAVGQLRAKGLHPSRWAPYVHLGM